MLGLFQTLFKKRSKPIDAEATVHRLKTVAAFLLTCLTVHVFVIMRLENFSLTDSIWFTLTTVFTVGYGDIVLKTPAGKLATVVLVYFGGILTLGKVASDWFDFRNMKREKILTGNWRHNMQDHMVIFGSPKNEYIDFFTRLNAELLFNFGQQMPRIIVATDHWGTRMHEGIQKLNFEFCNSSQYSPDIFHKVDLKTAKYVMVLSDSYSQNSLDCANIELVARIRKYGFTGSIVAESSNPENHARLREVGATSAIRPLRSYPELLAKALLHPGSEMILENLFSARGDDLVKTELSFQGSWRDFVIHCLDHQDAMPLAVWTREGEFITNGLNRTNLNICSAYLLKKENAQRVQQGLALVAEIRRVG